MKYDNSPRVIIMMGVMSAGKTFFGQKLAQTLNWELYECDRAHSPANKDKMRAGIPLTDEDRYPWLQTLAGQIKTWHEQKKNVVLTCPAHKQRYRDILRVAPVQFIYLHAPKSVLVHRARNRQHEYMNPSLINSQLAIMEKPKPSEAIAVNTNAPVSVVLEQMLSQLCSVGLTQSCHLLSQK